MAWVFSLFWMLYFCVSKREAPCWCQRGANVSFLPLSTSEEFWELPRLASGSHPTPIWRSRMYSREPHSDSSPSLGSPWGRQQHDCFLWQHQTLAMAGWAAFSHGRSGAVTMVSTPRTSSSPTCGCRHWWPHLLLQVTNTWPFYFLHLLPPGDLRQTGWDWGPLTVLPIEAQSFPGWAKHT